MYRPRYCAECGHRIERERWRFWHSRQFCQTCARVLERRRRIRLSALLVVSFALGVGIGVERTLLVLQALSVPMPEPPRLEVFVVAFGDAARPVALQVAQQLRTAGIACDLDLEGRSPKAQMRIANRTGARYAILLGEGELQTATATVKDLVSHEQTTVPQAEITAWIRQRLP